MRSIAEGVSSSTAIAVMPLVSRSERVEVRKETTGFGSSSSIVRVAEIGEPRLAWVGVPRVAMTVSGPSGSASSMIVIGRSTCVVPGAKTTEPMAL